MRVSGPWNREQIADFLESVRIPVRLACHGRSGHPVLASLWYLRRGDSLWCATQRGADVTRLLTADPRCAFEVSVESVPYRGVRGAARAVIHESEGEAILRQLLERYLPDPDSNFARSLLARADREVAIELQPQNVLSWDFAQRMKDGG